MKTLVYRRKKVAEVMAEEEPKLSEIPLLKQLTGEELTWLEKNVSRKFYKKRTVIYQEGCRHRGLYCVLKGVIKIYKIGVNGKQQILCFAQKGGIIAYRSLLSKELACTSAKAYEDSLLCHIPYAVLMNLLQRNWNFAHAMMQMMCRELRESNTFVIDIAQKSVRGRTAEMLLLLKKEFGLDKSGALKISITREDLANMVGTVTESLIRIMSEFKHEGILDLPGRKIVFVDVVRLKAVAELM